MLRGKKFKGRLDLKWNTGSDACRAGRYPAKLPTCKKEGLKDSSHKANESLFNKGNHQQTKVYANVVHGGEHVPSPRREQNLAVSAKRLGLRFIKYIGGQVF